MLTLGTQCLGGDQMRTEQEMIGLILGVAADDERVRAVVMSGSRADPNAPRDVFQDYDIVYFVTDLDSYIEDMSWVDIFGERMIMQMPKPDCGLIYLMQFTDGNRIDLTLASLSEKHEFCTKDKLAVVLMDKDNLLSALPAPTDEDCWVKPPSSEDYDECCNEFWWVAIYVAKGLCRREILYAKWHLDRIVREMLLQMLEWEAGIGTDFSASMGKCRKRLEAHLPEEQWQALLLTYADGSYDGTWNALLAACDLFRQTAKFVASHFGYEYPDGDDRRVSEHLERLAEERESARGS